MSKKVAIIFLLLAFCLSGIAYMLNRNKITGVSKIIKNTTPVNLDIWVSEIPSNKKNLIKTGESVKFIVRNRPHGTLKITDFKCQKTEDLVRINRYGLYKINLKNNISPDIYECRIYLRDEEAFLTENNGYISRGNSLKIPMKVSLESENLYLDGIITDISPAK